MNTKDLSEISLIDQLSKGSHIAFRELFMKYHMKIFYFIFGFLKSEKKAEDMTQEVFMKLWIERQQLSDIKNFGAFLYVLARNMVLNDIEKNKVAQKHLQHFEAPDTDHSSPQELLIAQDLQLLIDMAVDLMPSQRQLIYRLSREKGLSNDEIAEQLNLSKKTVQNHLTLALKELRKIIQIFILLYFVN